MNNIGYIIVHIVAESVHYQKSYHTNGHNISLQFARRFFASDVFAPCNWPAEFILGFYPLLQKFNYQKGALVQESFQTVVAKSTEFSCVPFPPV